MGVMLDAILDLEGFYVINHVFVDFNRFLDPENMGINPNIIQKWWIIRNLCPLPVLAAILDAILDLAAILDAILDLEGFYVISHVFVDFNRFLDPENVGINPTIIQNWWIIKNLCQLPVLAAILDAILNI